MVDKVNYPCDRNTLFSCHIINEIAPTNLTNLF